MVIQKGKHYSKLSKESLGGGKVMEYLEVLRKYEYYRNYKKRTASMKFVKFLYYRWRYDILGLKTGISIAPDTFGYGLYPTLWFHSGWEE